MKKKITAICLCIALVAIAVVGASLAYFTDKTTAVQNTFTMGGVKIDLTEPKWNPQESHKLMPGVSFAKDPTITVKDGSEDSYVFLEMSLNKYNSLIWVMAADASADKDIEFTIFNADGSLKNEFKNESGVFSTSKFLNEVQKNKAVFQAIVNKWFQGITHENWEVLSLKWGTENTDSKLLTIKLAYIKDGGVLKAGNSVTFMNKFGMPGSVTQKMIDDGKTVGGMQNTFNTEKVPLKMNFTAYAVQAEGFNSPSDAWKATFGK